MPIPAALAGAAALAPAVAGISGTVASTLRTELSPTERAKRRYTAKLGKRIAAGGDLVSDVEMQEFKQGQQEAVEAGLKAQQMQLGQAAKAAAGAGPFMEQQYQKGAEKLAKAQAASAVEQASAAAQYKQSLEQQRRAEFMELSAEQRAANVERERMMAQAVNWYASMPDDAFGRIFDPAQAAQNAQAMAGAEVDAMKAKAEAYRSGNMTPEGTV